MDVFKIKPTVNNSYGCALVAANTQEEAINTYTGSAMYRDRFYKEGGCIIDIVASLECNVKHSCILFDEIKIIESIVPDGAKITVDLDTKRN